MQKTILATLATMFLTLTSASALAQTSQPVLAPDPMIAIDALRTAAVESFNKGDLPGLLSHLDDDVVVTWQNGEVCRGPAEVKAYYDKMMSGPDKVVAAVSTDPKVTGRHLYGDYAVSWGEMNDHFTLTDGRDLPLNSKFTATIAKRGDVWKITSFHVSVNAFDNAILRLGIARGSTWAAIVAGFVALLLGFAISRLLQARKAS